MMKYYFLFGCFSVTKYVFLVTPETIQNTRRALTMTLDPNQTPIVGENWANSPDSAFVIMCAPRNCPLFMSKSEAACLQMDLARSSRGVGRSNDYRYILTRTRTEGYGHIYKIYGHLSPKFSKTSKIIYMAIRRFFGVFI